MASKPSKSRERGSGKSQRKIVLWRVAHQRAQRQSTIETHATSCQLDMFTDDRMLAEPRASGSSVACIKDDSTGKAGSVKTPKA